MTDDKKPVSDRLLELFQKKFDADDWRGMILTLNLEAGDLFCLIHLAEKGIKAFSQELVTGEAPAFATLASGQWTLEKVLKKVTSLLYPKGE